MYLQKFMWEYRLTDGSVTHQSGIIYCWKLLQSIAIDIFWPVCYCREETGGMQIIVVLI